jgi:glycosyltransferase involved in cell wall biosynthesis
MLAFRLLDLGEQADRLITVRPPSHLLRHPRKVVWFIHHLRTAYDLWGTTYQEIPNTPEGLTCKDAIVQADSIALREASRLYANSREVQRRLRQYNDLDSTVLYPPLPNSDIFHCGPSGDYILYVSRMVHHKRQWLAVEALRFTKTPVRLILAGPCDPDAALYLRRLNSMIHEYGLASRVTVVPTWISERDKADLFAKCLASIYMPYNEDSYGYPTLESFQSGKPVITTSDSGGTTELVSDGVNGIVSAPDAEAIAEAMDTLFLNRQTALDLGLLGRAIVGEHHLSWENAIDKLLQ